MQLQSEFSREFKKKQFRPFAAPSKCCPVRPAPPSLRLCPRLRTSFSPSTSTPVDVVFSHCTLCRSLELHWQHAVQLTSVVFRTSKTKIQCSGCQLHILLLHEKFHTTIYRVAYSNACIRIFIVCEISTAFRGVPVKTNSVPAPGFPRSSHFRSPRGIPATFIPIPAESAGFPPSQLPCRPLSYSAAGIGLPIRWRQKPRVVDNPALQRCRAVHKVV